MYALHSVYMINSADSMALAYEQLKKFKVSKLLLHQIASDECAQSLWFVFDRKGKKSVRCVLLVKEAPPYGVAYVDEESVDEWMLGEYDDWHNIPQIILTALKNGYQGSDMADIL